MTVTAGGSGTQGWPNLSIRSHSPSQRNEVEQKINLRKKVSCWQPRWENHLKVEPHRRNDSFACQFGIWYASVSALTMFDLIQFSLYRPSSQQELPQGALYCKPKTLKSSEREPLDQVQNVAASCFLQLSDIYNLTLTSLSPKSHKTMAKKQWIVSAIYLSASLVNHNNSKNGHSLTWS